MNPKTKECVEVLGELLALEKLTKDLPKNIQYPRYGSALSYALTTLPKYEEALRKIVAYKKWALKEGISYYLQLEKVTDIAKNVLEG